MRIFQFNFQPHFGGGEVYTKFLCRSLDRLGVATTLVHLDSARFWQDVDLPATTRLMPVTDIAAVPGLLPTTCSWLLSHGYFPEPMAGNLSRRHLLTAIAHMPPQGRARDRYEHYECVFGVSAHVVDGLRAIGAKAWDEPLYGVADLRRTASPAPIRQTSCHDWDRRKGRDRLLGWLDPWIEPLRRRPLYQRRHGITLGVVSRLTPIKQFPELFSIIAPLMARNAGLRLEIFGAGGYASVRDLRRATRPLGDRVRFWGHQRDVAAVYPQIDYLLTGLPEKEALGLNAIEAQACGTPVLAVNAPPFTETVAEGITGLFYDDPRRDGGRSFSALLERIVREPFRIDMERARPCLLRFSEAEFDQRIARMSAHIDRLLQSR